MVEPKKKLKIEIKNLNVWYGTHRALQDFNLDVCQNEILAVIGPANAGKSSFLRCLNRMSDVVPGMRVEGEMYLDGQSIADYREPNSLRRRIGMVSPLPVGLPLTIRENVTFAPRMAGERDSKALEELTERCLKHAALWDEVKDRLDTLATKLSGGQQQRLTIARALSHRPEVLCLDEFSIAIDPVTTMRIEEVLDRLRREMTIILVTNLNQQARRLADRTAMVYEGSVLEIQPTETLFSGKTKDPRTQDYIEGRFG